jgi:hypothetical protein
VIFHSYVSLPEGDINFRSMFCPIKLAFFSNKHKDLRKVKQTFDIRSLTQTCRFLYQQKRIQITITFLRDPHRGIYILPYNLTFYLTYVLIASYLPSCDILFDTLSDIPS